jgi:DNA-binding response OmpR family regulator
VQILYISPRSPDRWLVDGLRQMGHVVEVGEWAPEAAVLAGEGGYDLVFADMTEAHAETVAKLSDGAPLVVIADVAAAADRAAALRAGAEACLVRPLHLIEVRTQLMALARHGDRLREAALRRGGLALDRGARRLSLYGREAGLSAIEFRLVAYLFRRQGQVVDLATLDRHLSGETVEPQPDRIRSLVSRLRSKLRRELGAPLLHSVRGHGYVLRTEAGDD